MTGYITILTPHRPQTDKLACVTTEMRRLGAPSIRVVDCGDHYMALEGCHRIAAAAATETPVDLIVLEQDDMVEADSLDWQDLQPGETYTAGELAGEAYSPQSAVYQYDGDTGQVMQTAQ